MLIEIASLTDEPLTVEYTISPQELDFRHETAELAGDVDFRSTIQLLDEAGIIRCQGQCHALLDFQCSRCLDPYRQERNLEFNLLYAPQPKTPEHKKETELKQEDMDLGFYDGITFETNDIILEQLLLSIEMKALCREDCQGLCPVCGCNKNREECNCRLETAHPLQEQLLAIRESLSKKQKG